MTLTATHDRIFDNDLVATLITHTEQGLLKSNPNLADAAEFIVKSHLNPSHYAMPILQATPEWIGAQLRTGNYNALEQQLAFETTRTTLGIVRVMVRTHLNRQYVRHVVRGASDQTLTPRVMKAFEQEMDFAALTDPQAYAAHWQSIVDNNPSLYDGIDRAAIAMLPKLKSGHWQASNIVANKLGMDDAWAKVLTGIYTGLVYLNDAYQFNPKTLWADMDATVGSAKAAKKLAQSFQKYVHQYGEALSGSFLADLGHTEFVKPDTHVISAVAALKGEEKVSPQTAIEHVYQLSEELSVPPRLIDKVFYLGGSGQFYLYSIKMKHKKTFKQDFLESLRAL
ncbi:MAG: hypothetical protein ACQEVQ_03425 [Pseudomonadota bacterium]